MSWLWALPPVIVVTGLAVAMGLAREMARAARSVRAEVEVVGTLRPAIADLQGDLRRLTAPGRRGGRR